VSDTPVPVPFNRPFMTGRELAFIAEAHDRGHLAGDGTFTAQCHQWLEERTHASKALLTHSCTAALEMAALLLELAPGDEVIMPSYTFVSTANAFALHGGTPVFVDVRPDTLNLDESLLEQALTDRTKAVCVVHYAGVAAEMDTILAFAEKHGLRVVEDAAQGILASYKGRPLGTIGDLGTLSFHETKNIIAGEGGALLCRDAEFAERAEILREKGTNRSRFFRGLVDKYTWVDVGSSYLPAEVTAAFLLAQMEHADEITARRMAIWDSYHAWAEPFERAGILRRPVVPQECQHNAHMYYLLLPSLAERTAFINGLKAKGIHCVFHYVPLHSSPAGSRVGRTAGSLEVTDSVAGRLVRMPLWLGLEDRLDEVQEAAGEVLGQL
jgi:dTDP-4-amino-4,6-dideoxygalactose transaminase